MSAESARVDSSPRVVYLGLGRQEWGRPMYTKLLSIFGELPPCSELEFWTSDRHGNGVVALRRRFRQICVGVSYLSYPCQYCGVSFWGRG